MNKLKLSAIVMLGIFVGSTALMGVASAADTKVTLAIAAGALTIGSPVELALTTPLTASFDDQTITQDFAWVENYFWVEDLKGARQGYTTTLQMSGDLLDPDGWVLSGSSVFFKVLAGLTLIAGKQEKNVVIPADSATYKSLWTAQTLINRATAAKKPQLSKYGVNIWLQVTVPGGQAGGSYAGTLVYTLTEL